MTKSSSDSAPQQEAEKQIIQALIADLPKLAAHEDSDNDKHYSINDLTLKPDWIDKEKKIVVEVFAHIGKLGPGQKRKVAQDVLKLAYIDKATGEQWRKILCFACSEAAKYVDVDKGSPSWVAKAVEAFGIEVRVVPLPPEQFASVKAAQQRQNKTNST